MISRYDQGGSRKNSSGCCTSPMTRPWAPFFKQEMAKPYFSNLDFMISQYEKLETVFPGPYQIFRAFFGSAGRRQGHHPGPRPLS